MLRMARHAHALTGMRRPGAGRRRRAQLRRATAGSCAKGRSSSIWIQPAAGDAGGALGAALFVWHQLLDNEPRSATAATTRCAARCSGPAYSDGDRRAFSTVSSARIAATTDEAALCDAVADLIADEQVVGWSGRMEFGPRALGNRSILGDARIAADAVADEPEDQVPRVVPAVRALRAARARVTSTSSCDRDDSPYMLLVAGVRADKRLPARRRGRRAGASTSSSRRAR